MDWTGRPKDGKDGRDGGRSGGRFANSLPPFPSLSRTVDRSLACHACSSSLVSPCLIGGVRLRCSLCESCESEEATMAAMAENLGLPVTAAQEDLSPEVGVGSTESFPEPDMERSKVAVREIEALIDSIGDFETDDIDFSQFSDDVQDALAELLSSDDPLDQEDFDPVAYINQQFPDEASLARVDTFLANLDQQIQDVSQDISSILHRQATQKERAHDQVREAKEQVKQLYVQVKDIKAEAEKSETMVDEICKDIKQLDNAKTNLQTTITTLKRLHMLVTAVDQLEFMSERRRYGEAGNLLQAVNELHEYFADYNEVPKIAELRASVDETKKALTNRVLEDFKYIRVLASDDRPGDDEPSDPSTSPVPGLNSIDQLSEACIVVDALGPVIRETIIARFCDIQLNVYDAIFRENGGEDKLETIERRYAWWRRMVRNYEEKYGEVFPRHWRILHRLALDFARRTRESIANILMRIDPPESADVELLLKGLTKTLAFEREAAATFEVDAARNAVMGAYALNEQSDMVMDDDGNVVDSNSAAGIRLKYKRQAEQAERESKVAAMEKEAEENAKAGVQDTTPSFRGLISQCFDAYMIAYVKLERKNMDNMLLEVDKEEGRRVGDDSGLPVLDSAVNMFGYIKQSVKRCTGYSTGQAFYSLQKEYVEVLAKYANLLIGKLPKPTSGSGSTAAYRLGTGVDVLQMACLVINTAEYCTETIPQLVDMVTEKIDDAFKEHISMESVEDTYYDVINVAVRVLSTGLEAKLLTQLDVMTKLPWGTWSDVGDQSDYIAQIHQACMDTVPLLRKTLSETYFRSFCDSFVTTFLPNYTKYLHKCRSISELGAQQLLLDTQSLKTMMSELRTLGLEDTGVDTADGQPRRMDAFCKVVYREIGKAEGLLKLVGTPTFRLAESFPLLWPGASEQDLRSLMELKGIKKKEQQDILEQYKSRADYVPPAPVNDSAGGGDEGDRVAKKKDFWSFVNDTKKNMETGVEKAKKAAAASMAGLK